MGDISLVTGANGHLGNNLVRTLLAKGQATLAGVRNPAHRAMFSSWGCQTAQLDLLDKASLTKAMRGVDVLYQVGAVFKHWAKDAEREIYQANLLGTRNALEAAAQAGVRRVVYVSSMAALDRSRLPITETTWNPERANVYFRSKTDAEKLAWELADRLGLDMVSVLPGAIIGANCLSMTPTMNLLAIVLAGKLSANPGFFFNFVDVADVAEGCWLAAVKGKAGERYLLANENYSDVAEIFRLAQSEFPERGLKLPPTPPRALLRIIVALMEGVSRLRGVEPELQSNYLTTFSVREACDISKARNELGFSPKPPAAAIIDALRHLATVNP